MKRQWIAAILAVFMIFTMTACKGDSEQTLPDAPFQEDTETKPVQTPEESEEEEPEVEPETQPETETEPDQEPSVPVEEAVQVQTESKEGYIEELVSYQIQVPKIELEDPAAAEAINSYYQSVAGKVEDYAWGEAYEAAMEDHGFNHVEAAFSVEYNQGNIISVFRSVITTSSGGTVTTTYSAETFDLRNGGLLTADDFFTETQENYQEVLLSAVISQIDEGGGLPEEGWENTVRASFDKTQFYLTETSYVVYFQEEDLDGIISVPIDREEILADVFQMPA